MIYERCSIRFSLSDILDSNSQETDINVEHLQLFVQILFVLFTLQYSSSLPCSQSTIPLQTLFIVR